LREVGDALGGRDYTAVAIRRFEANARTDPGPRKVIEKVAPSCIGTEGAEPGHAPIAGPVAGTGAGRGLSKLPGRRPARGQMVRTSDPGVRL
jgi:hypothetical protein